MVITYGYSSGAAGLDGAADADREPHGLRMGDSL